MHFITATNRLTAKTSLADLAREMGVSQNGVLQARLDPAAASYRRPPEGWQAVVARMARKRADDLLKLADALEPSEG
ncbi:MAG TPA: hypothetical protein VMM79_14310 [Longimicrobiales bacterium]|nr:hypothetical protein [Longimicrobiales bacterium]